MNPASVQPFEKSAACEDVSGQAAREARHTSILGTFTDMSANAVVVHQSRCVRVRNRNVDCLKCADACTSGCISVKDATLSIDASQCVGCGTCATVCPTCALEACHPSDAKLQQSCIASLTNSEIVIACSQATRACEGLYDQARVAYVVCAGRVDESLVLDLAVQGACRIHIVCGSCEACAQRAGRDTAKLVASTANELFEAWGHEARVTVEDALPETVLVAGVDARTAFEAMEAYFQTPRSCDPIDLVSTEGCSEELSTVADANSESLAPGLARVMADGTLPHFVPDRRERLLDSLVALGEPQASSVATRLWGCVVIDGMKCSSCRMCATFCPTGAISKFDDTDGTFGVNHYPGDCVKCGSCRDICPEDAIVLLDAVKPDYLLSGTMHRYTMRPRRVQLNDPHQILNTMKEHLGSQIYER